MMPPDMTTLAGQAEMGLQRPDQSNQTGQIYIYSAVEFFTMLALSMTSFAGQPILRWNLLARRAVVVIVVDIGLGGIA